jgi:hypothetical protein
MYYCLLSISKRRKEKLEKVKIQDTISGEIKGSGVRIARGGKRRVGLENQRSRRR